MGIIIDLIALGIIIGAAIIGMNKGFISTVISIAKWIAAALAAGILATTAAGFIYDSFLAGGIEEKINEYIPEIKITEELPKIDASFVNEILEKYDINISVTADEMTENGKNFDEEIRTGSDTAHAISIAYIRPIYLQMIRPVCYTVIFILVLLIGIIAEKVFKVANKVPLVGDANKVLGFITGLLYGGLIVVLVCAVIAVIISVTRNSLSWLNTKTFEDSAVRFIIGISR